MNGWWYFVSLSVAPPFDICEYLSIQAFTGPWIIYFSGVMFGCEEFIGGYNGYIAHPPAFHRADILAPSGTRGLLNRLLFCAPDSELHIGLGKC